MGKRHFLLKETLKKTLKIILTCVVAAGVTACPVFSYASYAFDDSGSGLSDEEVALGLYGEDGQDTYGYDNSTREERLSEPLLEVSGYTFAEALAQEYRPDEGTFILYPWASFYIESPETEDGADAEGPSDELLATVSLMAAEYAEHGVPSERPLQITQGGPDGEKAGDIIICLTDEEEFLSGGVSSDESQCYRLIIGDRIWIKACSADGVYYGLITLMEMAMESRGSASADAAGATAGQPADTGAGIVLSRCRVTDGPDLEERTIFLDCGRKYFEPAWIEALIRRSSLQRYNTIVLHFSEAEGLRLDSEVFPWLTDGIKSLSTEEMAEIVRYAERYHMKVVPSFDTPGHNSYLVRRYAGYAEAHPDFSFTCDGVTYDSGTEGFTSIANHYSVKGETLDSDSIGIDITKEHAVAFINALVDGYADFFRALGCEDFDICGDEILGWNSFELGGKSLDYDNRWQALEHWAKYARKVLGIEKGSASDAYVSYLNELAARLRDKGFECRVFNDDLDINKNQHTELEAAVDVTYWYDADNSAEHFMDQGHSVYYCKWQWCYYVVRRQGSGDIMKKRYKRVNSRNIFENWDAGADGGFDGAYFCIWCDHPDYKSADTIWDETFLRTWASAAKMWNAGVSTEESGINNAATYDSMKNFAEMMKTGLD